MSSCIFVLSNGIKNYVPLWMSISASSSHARDLQSTQFLHAASKCPQIWAAHGLAMTYLTSSMTVRTYLRLNPPEF